MKRGRKSGAERPPDRWHLPEEPNPGNIPLGPIEREVRRFNRLQQYAALVNSDGDGENSFALIPAPLPITFSRVPSYGDNLLGDYPPPVTRLIDTVIEQSVVRNEVPEEHRMAPHFLQEKYRQFLVGDSSTNYTLLGSKADVSELLTTRYEDSARETLEEDIGSWLDKMFGQGPEEENARSERRLAEVSSDDTDAKRGSAVVEQATYELMDCGTRLRDIFETAAKMIRQRDKRREGRGGMPTVRCTKSTQTAITFGVKGRREGDIDVEIEPSSEGGTAQPRLEMQQFNQSVSIDLIVREKNRHITQLMQKMEAYKAHSQESKVLLKAELRLNELLLNRLKAEVQFLSTGIGFTGEWGDPLNGKLPEIDVEALMEELRGSITELNREDRRTIREQAALIQDLKTQLESEGLDAQREIYAIKKDLDTLTAERDELRREIQYREEVIAFREEKIREQHEQFEDVMDQIRAIEGTKAEHEEKQRLLEEECKALKEKMAGMISREEAEVMVADERQRVETVRRIREGESRVQRGKADDLQRQLADSRRKVEELSNQMQVTAGELLTEKEKGQSIASAFLSDFGTVLASVEVIRQACVTEENNDFRSTVWRCTNELLEQLSLGFSNPHSHLFSHQHDRHSRKLKAQAFSIPPDPLLLKVGELETSVEGLQGKVQEITEKEKKTRVALRNTEDAGTFLKIYTRSMRRATVQMSELTTPSAVRDSVPPPVSRTLEEFPSDKWRFIEDQWSSEVKELQAMFGIVRKLRAELLEYKKELGATRQRASRMATADKLSETQGASLSCVSESAVATVTQLRDLGMRLRSKVLDPAVRLLQKAKLEGGMAKYFTALMDREAKLSRDYVLLLLRKTMISIRKRVADKKRIARRDWLWKKHNQAKQAGEVEEAAALLDGIEEHTRKGKLDEIQTIASVGKVSADIAKTGMDRIDNLIAVIDFWHEVQETEQSRSEVQKAVMKDQEMRSREVEDELRGCREKLDASSKREEELQKKVKELEEAVGGLVAAHRRKVAVPRKGDSVVQQMVQSARDSISPSSPLYKLAHEGFERGESQEALSEELCNIKTMYESYVKEAREKSEIEEAWRENLVRRIHLLERQLRKPETDPESYHPHADQRLGSVRSALNLNLSRSKVSRYTTRDVYCQTDPASITTATSVRLEVRKAPQASRPNIVMDERPDRAPITVSTSKPKKPRETSPPPSFIGGMVKSWFKKDDDDARGKVRVGSAGSIRGTTSIPSRPSSGGSQKEVNPNLEAAGVGYVSTVGGGLLPKRTLEEIDVEPPSAPPLLPPPPRSETPSRTTSPRPAPVYSGADTAKPPRSVSPLVPVPLFFTDGEWVDLPPSTAFSRLSHGMEVRLALGDGRVGVPALVGDFDEKLGAVILQLRNPAPTHQEPSSGDEKVLPLPMAPPPHWRSPAFRQSLEKYAKRISSYMATRGMQMQAPTDVFSPHLPSSTTPSVGTAPYHPQAKKVGEASVLPRVNIPPSFQAPGGLRDFDGDLDIILGGAVGSKPSCPTLEDLFRVAAPEPPSPLDVVHEAVMSPTREKRKMVAPLVSAGSLPWTTENLARVLKKRKDLPREHITAWRKEYGPRLTVHSTIAGVLCVVMASTVGPSTRRPRSGIVKPQRRTPTKSTTLAKDTAPATPTPDVILDTSHVYQRSPLPSPTELHQGRGASSDP